jgi:hypothetical protein
LEADYELTRPVAQKCPREAFWYAMQWKIETLHKILKSGCKAETSKLRTAERIVILIAVLCILSWRFLDDHDESVGTSGFAISGRYQHRNTRA